jgi:hypothetical protein
MEIVARTTADHGTKPMIGAVVRANVGANVGKNVDGIEEV